MICNRCLNVLSLRFVDFQICWKHEKIVVNPYQNQVIEIWLTQGSLEGLLMLRSGEENGPFPYKKGVLNSLQKKVWMTGDEVVFFHICESENYDGDKRYVSFCMQRLVQKCSERDHKACNVLWKGKRIFEMWRRSREVSVWLVFCKFASTRQRAW